jgi:hypothetical protein
MPIPTDIKGKAERIDWGYHARPRRSGTTAIGRGVRLALAALLVASVGYAVVAFRLQTPADRLVSPGPVVHPHGMWDQDCQVCHVPFASIRSEAASGRCQECHSGPPHHPHERPGDARGCAECHRDHRGPDASLVLVEDRACTRCHQDLSAHREHDSKLADGVRSITGFADPSGGHPEFRPVATPPRRTLKFSHATHTATGFGIGFKYAQIADADRQRYRELAGGPAAKAAVKLDCRACHQPDAGRVEPGSPGPRPTEKFAAGFRPADFQLPREPLQPPRADGRHHLPINYEAHCHACHPLTFDDDPRPAGRQAPHRLQPPRLDEYLWGVYAELLVRGQFGAIPIPGRADDRLDLRELVPREQATIRDAIARRVEAAKDALYLGGRACQKCHMVELPEATDPAGRNPLHPVRIVPPAVPVVWLPRARFSHTAHRFNDCQVCHLAACQSKDDEVRSAVARTPVGQPDRHYQHPPDLPNVAECRTCHSPRGGAGSRCTECHTYHVVDRGLQGRGSVHRGVIRESAPYPPSP